MTRKQELENLYQASIEAPSGGEILEVAIEVMDLLIRKNISYGDSALHPNGIFAKGDAVEQLSARLDDKLNRVKNNQSFEGEGMLDAIDDIIGYLVLLKIALRNKEEEKPDTKWHYLIKDGQIQQSPV